MLTTCMGGAIASLLLLSLPGAGVSASVLFSLVDVAPAGVIMATAVVKHSFAGVDQPDLAPLFEVGAALGHSLRSTPMTISAGLNPQITAAT